MAKKVHKRLSCYDPEWVTLCGTFIGNQDLWRIKVPATVSWRRVTCKRCLRMKRVRVAPPTQHRRPSKVHVLESPRRTRCGRVLKKYKRWPKGSVVQDARLVTCGLCTNILGYKFVMVKAGRDAQ